MSVTSDQARAFGESFANLLSDLQDRHRSAFEQQIDVHRDLLQRYRQQLEQERTRETDVFQDFTRMVMSTFMEAVALQRDTRTRFLELQSSLADAHLRFLDDLKAHLATPAADATQAEQPSGGRPQAR